MNKIQEYIQQKLEASFTRREARNIAQLMTDHFIQPGIGELKRATDVDEIDSAIVRVLSGEPVQYVIKSAWFYNRQLYVTSDVLIPRPETEELVEWILKDCAECGALRTIDIGTGSGCIAVTLKIHMPDMTVTALDISRDALLVAQRNAELYNVDIQMLQRDFLSEGLLALETFDVIVSNPPYVLTSEFEQLASSVKNFEPHIALTPGGQDAFIFYRKIALHAAGHLNPGGHVYVELNEFHPAEIESIFLEADWQTERREDMQGKWRMMKASR